MEPNNCCSEQWFSLVFLMGSQELGTREVVFGSLGSFPTTQTSPRWDGKEMLWTCMNWMDANPYCLHTGSIPSGSCGVDGFYLKPRRRRIHTWVKSHPGIFLLLGKWMGPTQARHCWSSKAETMHRTGIIPKKKTSLTPGIRVWRQGFK